MEDMLSLEDEVLDSVFQYHRSNVSRIPTHVWTKLRSNMEGLLIERYHGCLTWKHDSLVEIARARYSHDKIKYYHLLANYFGNRFSSEIIEKKKIAKVDLLLDGYSVWLKNSRPNYRRCEEAVHALIFSRNLEQAILTLCNFEYLCAAYRCNEGIEVIHSLELILQEATRAGIVSGSGTGGTTATVATAATIDVVKVRDYLTWLRRADERILDDPQIFIPVTVTLEPPTSRARQDYLKYLKHLNENLIHSQIDNPSTSLLFSSSATMASTPIPPATVTTTTSSTTTFVGDVWIRGISLGSIADLSNSSLIRGSICVSWSPDSTHVLSVADDRIRLWDIVHVEVSTELRNRNHKTVTEGVWNPEGNRIVCRSWDGTVTVWNLRQRTVLYSLTQQRVRDYDTSGVASTTASIRSIGSHGSQHTSSLSIRSTNSSSTSNSQLNITAVAWHPTSPYLITGSQDSLLMLWDATNGNYLSTLKKIPDYYILSLSWNPNGRDLAIVTLSTHVHIYRMDTKDTIVYHQHTNQVNSISWNLHGNYLTSCSDDHTVHIWNNPYDSGGNTTSTSPLTTKGIFSKHQCAVRAVSWCGDNERIASGDECGKIIIWHWLTHQVFASWNGHTESIHTIIWSPDQKRLASSSKDGTVIVWESSKEIYKKPTRGGGRTGGGGGGGGGKNSKRNL
jgi:WD40 repeat protein